MEQFHTSVDQNESLIQTFTPDKADDNQTWMEKGSTVLKGVLAIFKNNLLAGPEPENYDELSATEQLHARMNSFFRLNGDQCKRFFLRNVTDPNEVNFVNKMFESSTKDGVTGLNVWWLATGQGLPTLAAATEEPVALSDDAAEPVNPEEMVVPETPAPDSIKEQEALQVNNDKVVAEFFDEDNDTPIKIRGINKEKKQAYRALLKKLVTNEAVALGIDLTDDVMKDLQAVLKQAGVTNADGSWPRRRTQAMTVGIYEALVVFLSKDPALQEEFKTIKDFFAKEKFVMMGAMKKRYLQVLVHLSAKKNFMVVDNKFLEKFKTYAQKNEALKNKKRWCFVDRNPDGFKDLVTKFCQQEKPKKEEVVVIKKEKLIDEEVIIEKPVVDEVEEKAEADGTTDKFQLGIFDITKSQIRLGDINEKPGKAELSRIVKANIDELVVVPVGTEVAVEGVRFFNDGKKLLFNTSDNQIWGTIQNPSQTVFETAKNTFTSDYKSVSQAPGKNLMFGDKSVTLATVGSFAVVDGKPWIRNQGAKLFEPITTPLLTINVKVWNNGKEIMTVPGQIKFDLSQNITASDIQYKVKPIISDADEAKIKSRYSVVSNTRPLNSPTIPQVGQGVAQSDKAPPIDITTVLGGLDAKTESMLNTYSLKPKKLVLERNGKQGIKYFLWGKGCGGCKDQMKKMSTWTPDKIKNWRFVEVDFTTQDTTPELFSFFREKTGKDLTEIPGSLDFGASGAVSYRDIR